MKGGRGSGAGGGAAPGAGGGGHDKSHTGRPGGRGGGEPRPVKVFAVPMEGAKFVYLVRHGQALHNVAARYRGREAYLDPALADAKLDDVGRGQAKDLRMTAGTLRGIDASSLVTPLFDVVLVSPLTRTLETATIAFPGDRMVAVEVIREASGRHPCDMRSPVEVVKPRFPHVDFTGIAPGPDSNYHPTNRETIRSVSARCDVFLDYLKARPEKHIAVVSHGVFLEVFMDKCGLQCVDRRMCADRFRNAEIRPMIVSGWQ